MLYRYKRDAAILHAGQISANNGGHIIRRKGHNIQVHMSKGAW